MALLKIREMQEDLVSMLGIEVKSFDSVGVGQNDPYIVLLGRKKGAMPVYTFGVFIPQKVIDRDSNKSYDLLDSIESGLFKGRFGERISAEYLSAGLKELGNGSIVYVCEIDVKQNLN